ncbi:MAG: hypothetical protein JRI68_22520 [Deltaproteobacteria bacterium]|nr:hypothetical protein [Deltaproteobacteria bacterium]
MRPTPLVLVALVAGCGQDGESAPDPPGPDAGAPLCLAGEVLLGGSCHSTGVPPEACAPGFASDDGGGCVAVLPPEPCPAGLMAVPGETACREVAPCGTGAWGTIPVEPSTQHVDAAYAGGVSDGSPTAPWTAVQDAVGAAEPGAIIAIAEGSYGEDVTISGKPVRLWGRCPALVEIVGSAGNMAAVFVRAGASGTEIRDLAIRGDDGGILVSGSQQVVVDRVWLHDAADRGIDVDSVLGETEVTLSRSLLESAGFVGVLVSGSQVTIEQSTIRDGQPDGDFEGGYGLYAISWSVADGRPLVGIQGSLFERNRAISVFGLGAEVIVDATHVRDTLDEIAGVTAGRGLAVENDGDLGTRSSLWVTRSVVERSGDLGIFVGGSDALIETTVVRDVGPAGDKSLGRGIDVARHPVTLDRGIVTIRQSLVERTQNVGIAAGGSDVVIETTWVREIYPDGSGLYGRGINIQDDPVLGLPAAGNLYATAVEATHDVGILVVGVEANVTATAIRGTRALADGTFGDGIAAFRLSTPTVLAISECIVEQNARAGVATFGAVVSLGSSTLECNTIHLDGEAFESFVYDLSDGGGNACGCAGQEVTCAVLSSNLTPPNPMP